MVGPRAYANYREAYNDCASEDLPKFVSEEEYLQHARRLMNEKNMLSDSDTFAKCRFIHLMKKLNIQLHCF